MTRLWHFHGGIHPAGQKKCSTTTAISDALIPSQLILPLSQHIGEPAEPVVKVGQQVKKGQVIAQCQGENCTGLSVYLHAPTSGTIRAIDSYPTPHPSGLNSPCIIIDTDGHDTWGERLPTFENYQDIDAEVLYQHIAKAGIVGLGGAGFPTHIKLNSPVIDTLILNAAECEPYITCDDMLMREAATEIIAGTQMVRHILGDVKRCIIAIEDNKPEAYDALNEHCEQHEHIELIKVPTLYPTGGERQLIKILIDQEIGRSELPAQHGIVVQNIATVYAIYHAIQHGTPLLSRTITVTGSAIAEPKNLHALLGTPMHALLNQCGCKSEVQRLIMGGSMMGFSVPSADLPIVKTSNCLIASCEEDIETSYNDPSPCIRCGSCMEACPINLLPQQMYWYTQSKEFKKVEQHNIFDCIECGCCAYVCPSHIPLVNYYRYAKSEIRSANVEREKSEIARQRHEFRTQRLEREAAERKARHKKKRALPKKTTTSTTTGEDDKESKKAVIAAALARAKAKKAATSENLEEKAVPTVAPSVDNTTEQ